MSPAAPQASIDDGELTGSQDRVLACIVSAIAGRGYPPSLREIAAQCGLAGASSAQYAVDQLVAKGRIRRVPGKARALRVVHLSAVSTAGTGD